MITEAKIKEKLTKLADLRCANAAITLRYQARMDADRAPIQAQIDALSAEVQKQCDELWASIMPQIDPLLAEIREIVNQGEAARDDEIAETADEAKSLEAEVRADVIRLGKSVKVDGLQCQYVSPKVTWDSKALVGYAAAHPEIEKFKSVSEPSTRIV